LTVRTKDGEDVTIGELKSVSVNLQDAEEMHEPAGTRQVTYSKDW